MLLLEHKHLQITMPSSKQRKIFAFKENVYNKGLVDISNPREHAVMENICESAQTLASLFSHV